MAYEFTIMDRGESASLAWLAERYDYAQALENAVLKAKVHPDWSIDSELYPVVFTIAECDAWYVQDAVESEDGYLTCMGGRLKQELEGFLAKIV